MQTPEIRPELAALGTQHSAAPAAHATLMVPAHTIIGSTEPPIRLPAISRQSLRRIPATIDPIGSAAAGLEGTLNPLRLAANSKVFGGLQQIQHHIGIILQTLARPKLPASIIGVVHQPDGSAAARVQLQFKPASIGAKGPVATVLSADNGSFTLGMPLGAEIPISGISLTVHGANQNTTVTVQADQIAANGMVGVLVLPTALSPLPVSIIAALQALTPVDRLPTSPPATPPQKKHTITLGEHGSVCTQTFAANERTDRFPWGLFFRIVEPQMSIATHAQEVVLAGSKKTWMPVYRTSGNSNAVPTKIVDRIPIDQPLSVDGFRDQIAGIATGDTFTEDETVPMAASIGLGYILRMAQQWKFLGLGLGDLVYSLPLAPGEQQQIAVFERTDTTAVQESESFSQAEIASQMASSDTSTTATFNQAFNEFVNGSSAFSTDSSSSSAGVSFGIGPIGFGGGGGSSSSSGSANSSLSGSRDTTAQAAQATHSSAENQAASRVNAQRTGMRLASASEDMGTTTKIITNHNHLHALTMQYWEVLSMYDVSTTIEGVTLVCLVPMQIVRFMPPGQPVLLTDPSTVNSSEKVMERYKNILRHLDILQRVVPRRFQHGLNLLAQFAADPTTIVDSSTTTAETVIKFELSGNFLVCEKISVAAVTKRNTRIGPVLLSPSVAGQPSPIPKDQFMTRDELTGWLSSQRQTTKTVLQASLALPPSVNRSDVVGFEITRQFTTVTYTLTSAAQQAAEQFISQQLHDTQVSFAQFLGEAIKAGGLAPLPTVVLGPSDLEPLLSGPTLVHFYAAIENFDKSGDDKPAAQETYANDAISGTVLPAQPFPIPALQIAPVLRYQDVLEIERAAQHVVRGTARYSKALWMSMTPEETAILLDGYTIGVPPGGLEDASQMIPLLNCVQNTVLGTFGNSLIMPFIIPQDLADQAGTDPAELQQTLLDYQRETFVSPHSTVALPTRGILGEAVLGSCPSGEKIDLTRFWNWQDAPADTAPGIGMVQLPTTTPPLTTGVTAPNSLTNLPPLINNLITAPQPNTALLQAMGDQAAKQADFNSALTGQQQLSSIMQGGQSLANQARSDALKTSQTMASKAMDQLSSLVGSAMKGSPTTPGTGSPAGTPSAPGKPAANAGTPTGTGKPAAKPGTPTGTPQTPTPGAPPSAGGPTSPVAAADSSGAADAAGATDGAAIAGATDAGGAAAGGGAASGIASVIGEVAPIIAAL
ncbi:MAG: hypothetical protein JO204_21290 [Alphaproteobacteria bacterium]|nr:hypothetical protein [Alphaproteobacteria bacterium]